MTSNNTATREWLSCGCLGDGVARGGLSALHGHSGLGSLGWHFATYIIIN